MTIQRTLGISVTDLDGIRENKIFYGKMPLRGISVEIIICIDRLINIIVSFKQKDAVVSDPGSYQYMNGRAFLCSHSECNLEAINSTLNLLVSKVCSDILAMDRSV